MSLFVETEKKNLVHEKILLHFYEVNGFYVFGHPDSCRREEILSIIEVVAKMPEWFPNIRMSMSNFGINKRTLKICDAEVAEWSNASVCKTDALTGYPGSNPGLSTLMQIFSAP